MTESVRIDPTLNVKEALQAAVERQDALRLAEAQRMDDLRETEARINKQASQYQSMLAAAESRRVDEQAAMRDKHAAELREAEAKRIDAVRSIDVEARKADNERAATQAGLLATQLATTAETLRNQVATTANAAQTQLQQLIAPLAEKVAVLEQSLYKGQGKEALSDPALVALTAQVAALVASQNTNAGQRDQQRATTSNNQWVTGLLIGGGIGLAGLAFSVVELILRLAGK